MANKINKPNKAVIPPYQDCINKSLQAIQHKKFPAAIEWAEKAVKKNPLLAQGYNTLAYAYDKNGQADKALEIMLNNDSQGKNAGYMLYCGELLLKRMDYEQAIHYFKQSLALQPEHNNARIGLIHIYRKQGNNALAYIEFMEIKKERPLSSHEKNVFLDVLTKINFHTSPLTTLQEIDTLLDDDSVERRKISAKVGELLLSAYPELTGEEAITLEHPIFSNANVLSLLKKFPMANAHIDYLLTGTRKLLLMSIAATGEISDLTIPLCQAIAQQNFLNEYIHFISDDEQQLLGMFTDLLLTQTIQPGWKISDSEAIILVLLMYYSLDKLPQVISAQLDLAAWPTGLLPFATEQLLNRETEIQLGNATPSLTDISADTPAHVRAQYEENPYPRWTECSLQQVGSLGQYIKNLMPELSLGAEFFNPHMRILIAGCGTGKQAIETAYLYPNAKITAFDISRRSLGYAQRMAKKLNIKNLTFFHGDILELKPSIGNFDLIECCGVLHHLAQPLTGWQKLAQLLSEKGIMRIDLYSRLARSEIIARKVQIEQLQLDSSITSLRAFRQAVLAQNTDQFLLRLRDFYVASEFRDLLFHQQEVQYTLDEIQASINQLGLSFVAMHADEARLARFRQEFPQAHINDLRYWNEFEQKYPMTFIGMYSFWCQNA